MEGRLLGFNEGGACMSQDLLKWTVEPVAVALYLCFSASVTTDDGVCVSLPFPNSKVSAVGNSHRRNHLAKDCLETVVGAEIFGDGWWKTGRFVHVQQDGWRLASRLVFVQRF
jgi:hypothetical protein